MKRDDRSRWVVDPGTGAPMPPRAQPGYYPGFHTLDQASFWDEATRGVVLARVHDLPPIRFFTAGERLTMEAVSERLLPQDDRDEEHRIPIVPFLDERLHARRGVGYRFEDMPDDATAYRLGLEAIDAISNHLHDRPFVELGTLEQDGVLKSLHDGRPPAGQAIWERMPVHRFFLMLVADVVDVYYAHPFAWDEIGFGGPAYPRGYMRLEGGKPEPWEVQERRYDWEPSSTSTPIVYEPVGGAAARNVAAGQGGTH